MTFERFREIAAKYRPDVIVSRHGEYFNGRSGWRLGIVFVDENGNESRVYTFGGSYGEVLNKLGIPVISKSDYETVKATLEGFKEQNGEINIFTGEPLDYSEYIAEYEAKLREYDSGKYVKDWEEV